MRWFGWGMIDLFREVEEILGKTDKVEVVEEAERYWLVCFYRGPLSVTRRVFKAEIMREAA